MNNLYLIGFMGVGKSSVADVFSQRGAEVIETDAEIEKSTGMTIRQIFEQYGEQHFRNLETALLDQLCRRRNLTVSCGGGMVLRRINIEKMKRSGKVILLTASPETILSRLKNDASRPLIKKGLDVATLSAMMAERRSKYLSAADITISTDGLTPETIADKISLQLGHLQKI